MTQARTSWLDEEGDTPIIEQYVHQMDSFVATMADGVVDTSELQAQEARLVALMREVEPRLDDELHAMVTQLLCELTAYDLMQTLYALHQSRPKSKFQG